VAVRLLFVRVSFSAVQMEDLEIALLVCLLVVLVQALCESRRSSEFKDDLLMESTLAGPAALDSNDSQVAISTAALYDYRVTTRLICFDDDLRYWVKSRCTLWFSQFLMSIYDDSRWVEFFRMGKGAVANMCYRLRGAIENHDTKYRLAVPVEVRVC
jgi:hypothetical protein